MLSIRAELPKHANLAMAAQLALCITDLNIGGAERALVELALRADRDRFHPVVYCLGPRPCPASLSLLPPLEEEGIDVHFLNGRRKLDLAAVARRLRQLLARQKADLVQTFLFHANFVGRLATRGACVPRVVSGIRVAERQQRWHLWADWLTSRWVDRYVCVSHSVADFSVREARLPARKIIVIPNGIDVGLYRAVSPADLRQFGIAPGRQVVTYVGRLDVQKGLDWLISSAPEWLALDRHRELLLVGKGPVEAALRRQAAATEFANRIHFLGWQSDIPQILAASQLLVLPSRWEGMPNVVLQAMASGLPVVATDVEGVRELLGPEAEMQTVAFGDSDALSERLCILLADPPLARRLGQANRVRAENEFAISRMVAAYEDLWDSVLRSDFAG